MTRRSSKATLSRVSAMHLLVHDLLEVVCMNVPRIGMGVGVEAGKFHQHWRHDCHSYPVHTASSLSFVVPLAVLIPEHGCQGEQSKANLPCWSSHRSQGAAVTGPASQDGAIIGPPSSPRQICEVE
ncbi:hypothetical protein ZEAMMB73_Zm00001d050808 [Zea mays]|uniref:Uncharacterized protein n=1 Tax=Zea mays TaxID=4577 RepID=A0A1D6Q3D7_MAIZE|nr:hypothetical protein ZEAMMB73_Zm00001d050808 [Zea mays]